MTTNITNLRKAGRLNEAYKLAEQNLTANPTDIWNVRNMAWVLYDYAKQKADNRVVLCFVSPGEDGLKVLFRLKERCYDAGLYSLFYKIFVHDFAQQYNFQQVIDAKTCDVTRACFISVDADAYFNADATPIDLKAYADVDNPTSAVRPKSRHGALADRKQTAGTAD